MKLWIRSQDRKYLISDSQLGYNEKNGQHSILAYIRDEYRVIGTYKTEERALEILDEIQSCIQTNAGFDMYCKLGRFANDFNNKYNLVPVYEIPKE